MIYLPKLKTSTGHWRCNLSKLNAARNRRNNAFERWLRAKIFIRPIVLVVGEKSFYSEESHMGYPGKSVFQFNDQNARNIEIVIRSERYAKFSVHCE